MQEKERKWSEVQLEMERTVWRNYTIKLFLSDSWVKICTTVFFSKIIRIKEN